ncbi:LacI family DNA-binding transcriptional regulator [Oceanobacillus aidingensis]|uniref:LacI family DNA-binding transcriptional regulator n=1 Tax=Oceanobacillus aidingensis TaxID=645964 RepID=A0ABV9JSK8_9BACI
MSTIRDVAKEAGVSVATVSRIINGKGKVKKETEDIVKAAIEKLSYTPNKVAQGLSNQRSYSIGFVVPSMSNPMFPEIARGVEDVAQANGYQVFLCNTDGKREKLLGYLENFKSHYIDGIILNSHNVHHDDLEQLKQHNVPVVMVDRVLENSETTSIMVQNRKGGQMATQHLVDVGCQYIAHIGGLEGEYNATQRMWGYCDIVSGKPWFDQTWLGRGDFSVDTGYRVAKELFSRHPEVDGIFAGNDLIAIGVLKAAYEWGKKVPEELAIVGFDGIEMSGLTLPPLTTIEQPIYEMGTLAMTELLNHIEKKDVTVKRYELDVKLIREMRTKIDL